MSERKRKATDPYTDAEKANLATGKPGQRWSWSEEEGWHWRDPSPEEREEDQRRKRMRCVPGGTVPRKVPEGRILVHNHIHHTPTTKCGDHGFRAWTDEEGTPNRVPCDCGWSGLPHYRVVLR